MVVHDGQKLGALAVLTLCLFYYGFSLFHARQSVPESPIPWSRQGPESLAIQVRGSRADGIYFMPHGTGLAQIFKVAGIPEDHSVSGSPGRGISDGTLLAISPAGEVTIAEMDTTAKLALGLRIDLNRASEADLSLVPGIGERMASQIMQLRLEKGAFHDLTDLMTVPGIKEKKLNSLKDYLMVGQAP